MSWYLYARPMFWLKISPWQMTFSLFIFMGYIYFQLYVMIFWNTQFSTEISINFYKLFFLWWLQCRCAIFYVVFVVVFCANQKERDETIKAMKFHLLWLFMRDRARDTSERWVKKSLMILILINFFFFNSFGHFFLN